RPVKPETTATPATTGATVEYQVKFSTGPKGARRMKAAPRVAAVPTPVAPSPTAPVAAPRIPKTTLLLVLGHHFERLIRDGVVRDYVEIARRTGMTRARVTQIVLTLLAPEIQEQILRAHPPSCTKTAERHLRLVTSSALW